jgi:hypothetical protein
MPVSYHAAISKAAPAQGQFKKFHHIIAWVPIIVISSQTDRSQILEPALSQHFGSEDRTRSPAPTRLQPPAINCLFLICQCLRRQSSAKVSRYLSMVRVQQQLTEPSRRAGFIKPSREVRLSISEQPVTLISALVGWSGSRE